jgi:4-amino-4-deoxy-L-arabinose transferase-like glycosyltransferase
MTLSMVRFTWHIVSILLVGFAILLMMLALAPDADPTTLLLRWVAALWLAATALAGWQARRRPSSLLRFPVPLVFVVIAVLCWTAST